MNVPSSLLAELALLSDVLDSPSSDISVTLSGLVVEVTRSVPSFVGLSMLVGDPGASIEITTIEDAEQAARIRTSLRFLLHGEDRSGRREFRVGVLIMYAAIPGALVDVAADLTWLTRRPFGDARLDEDLDGPATTSREESLSRLSTVNQALGALMGAGLTHAEATSDLDARAARTGADRHLVAADLLASLPGFDLAPGAEGP